MTYHNPVVGVDAGAFVESFDAYAPGEAGRARAPHNSFLMIAAELGIPALAVFGSARSGRFRLLLLGIAARRLRVPMTSLIPVDEVGSWTCALWSSSRP